VRPAVPEHLRLLVDGSQPLLGTAARSRAFGTGRARVDVDSDPVSSPADAAAFSVDRGGGLLRRDAALRRRAFEQQGAARAQALPALMSLSWQASSPDGGRSARRPRRRGW
jgi:hypothetical protein